VTIVSRWSRIRTVNLEAMKPKASERMEIQCAFKHIGGQKYQASNI
jgi:hypothetical protein